MKKKEKKAHGIQLLLRCIVRDLYGKVIGDTEEKPARSFLIQFLEFIYGLFRYNAHMYATATDGTEDYIYTTSSDSNFFFRVDAGVNVDTHGIVIGTGDTAETNTDYKLEAQIANGVGEGQMTHTSTTVSAVGVVGANVDLEVKRSFTNGSGGQITVKEAGIYTRAILAYQHCIVRDVLPAGIDVPDKCSISIIYTLRTTV